MAQKGIFPQALAEVTAGRKRSHWMWYIFPQISGLGSSEMSIYYAIRDHQEAVDYLAHPILGWRLREISAQLLQLKSCSALEIFGHPDHLKLHSSATLFAMITPRYSLFRQILDKYFSGQIDRETLLRLDLH